MEIFFFVLVLWIFSVCLHEFGHAIVAYYGGDYTVKEKGYLTLNPMLYVDPMGSILIPIIFLLMGGIGLPGGAVYIERQLLRSRGWSVAMSLAGPAMNLLLALAMCIPFWLHLVQPDPKSMVACALSFLIELQLCAVFFNLLPIPPLDGFQVVSNWMSEGQREQLLRNSNWFLWGTFLAMSYIPPVNEMFRSRVGGMMNLLHINSYLADLGYNSFMFWRH